MPYKESTCIPLLIWAFRLVTSRWDGWRWWLLSKWLNRLSLQMSRYGSNVKRFLPVQFMSSIAPFLVMFKQFLVNGTTPVDIPWHPWVLIWRCCRIRFTGNQQGLAMLTSWISKIHCPWRRYSTGHGCRIRGVDRSFFDAAVSWPDHRLPYSMGVLFWPILTLLKRASKIVITIISIENRLAIFVINWPRNSCRKDDIVVNDEVLDDFIDIVLIVDLNNWVRKFVLCPTYLILALGYWK